VASLSREKNALFAGHDQGAKNWAMTAFLLKTCKLNVIDPLTWLTDVLTKLVNLWPASRIEELMPLGLRRKTCLRPRQRGTTGRLQAISCKREALSTPCAHATIDNYQICSF
jgi:hypothetical protein